MIKYKICTKCKQELPATIEYFHKLRNRLNPTCKNCRKKYCQSRKKEKKEYDKNYYEINKEKINKRNEEYLAKRRKENPKAKISHSMSVTIRDAIRAQKNGRHWESFVDYGLDDLMKHLEKRFQPGMNWENYGRSGWVIDHRIPISVFNFSHSEHSDFQKCWALENLQPLWTEENNRKHASLERDFQPSLAM